MEFEILQHKSRDNYKIGGFEYLNQQIEESMSLIGVLSSSQYVKRYSTQVEKLSLKLQEIYVFIEHLKEFQRIWIYLDNIFASQDIRKARDQDFKDFEQINKNWGKVMRNINNQRSIRKNSSANRIKDIQQWLKQFEKISKALDSYLEEKRFAFPRLYFISNDELLKILANSTDLLSIEKQITKCFENV